MKLQGKKTGTLADFIGYIDQATPTMDPLTGKTMLTVRYKDEDGINCYTDYKTIAEFNEDWEDYTEPEPEKTELIEELEEAAKRADARAGRALEKIVELTATLKASISRIDEIEERLKTVEEITERLLREDNEQIIGKVKQYRLELPPRVAFERMKQDLRDWIEKNEVDKIRTYFHTEPDGRSGVRFTDKTHPGDNHLIIIGWPTVGLVDGATYTPDELLITGEAGKE